MSTDSVAVLKYGVELGLRTWKAFLDRLGWAADMVDKVICHQVGAGHRDTILKTLGIAAEKEFSTYRVPRQHRHGVAAADGRPGRGARVPLPGDRVGFLGIGSGLNCLMLGWSGESVDAACPACIPSPSRIPSDLRRPPPALPRRGRRRAGRHAARQPDLVLLLPQSGPRPARRLPRRSCPTTSAAACPTSRTIAATTTRWTAGSTTWKRCSNTSASARTSRWCCTTGAA